MLQIVERASESEGVESAKSEHKLELALPFQDRQRSRMRVTLSNGEEAALMLPRGTVLRGNELLKLSDGRVVTVSAAPERVSTVHADDARALTRAAYHLGNRHVPLEIDRAYVRYLHDHVLDAMVRELGLSVSVELAAFEPESGAYGRHTHAAGHSHGHGHSHSHDHAHEHADTQEGWRHGIGEKRDESLGD